MLLSCLFTTDEECRAKYERNLAQLARFGIVPRCVKDLLREKAEKRRVLFQCHSKAEKMVLDRLNEINEALTFMDEHDEDHEDVKVKVMLGVKRRIWMKKWANVRKVKADYHCLEFEQHEQQQQQQQQQQHQSEEGEKIVLFRFRSFSKKFFQKF